MILKFATLKTTSSTAAFSMAALSLVSIASAVAQSKSDFKGEPPKQSQIEKAYKECLVQIDEEIAEMKNSGSDKRREHLKAETSVCERSRRDCVQNPRGVECRAFVDDYADSMSE